MPSVLTSRVKRNLLRGCAVATVAIGILLPTAASAQISRVGISVGSLEPGIQMRGTDTAYDPVRDVYLLVTGSGPVFGVFVNAMGVPVTGAFAVMDGSLGWAHFPRAEYSPDVLGGQGGFLVTWHHNVGNANFVFGRIVSMASPALLASPIQQLSDGTEGGSWWETGPAMAYSQTSKRFLIAWRTLGYGISGRFVDVGGPPSAASSPWRLRRPGPAIATQHLPGMPRQMTSASWRLGGGLVERLRPFRKIRAFDGYVWPATYFGFGRGTFSSAIDVNTTNNNYVVAWGIHPGTMTAVFDPAGNLIVNSTLVTGRLGFDQSLGFAFNPVSGTFLAVSSDLSSYEIGGVEVTGYGAPNGAANIITNGARAGSFYPMVSARGSLNNWDVVYSRDFRGATNQLIATTATGGGQGPPPPPAPGPAPAPAPTSSCTIARSVRFNRRGHLHQWWLDSWRRTGAGTRTRPAGTGTGGRASADRGVHNA